MKREIEEELGLKYNPEGSVLRKIQKRMLDILITVDQICEKHNIPYWLEGGTLLGAVRHKGFIPWDDDVDIQILRKDCNKFQSILQKELPSEYILQTTKTDNLYSSTIMKIRDLNSDIIEKRAKRYKYNGIYIDVFIMDYCNPINEYIYTRQLKKIKQGIEGGESRNNITQILMSKMRVILLYISGIIGKYKFFNRIVYSDGYIFSGGMFDIEDIFPLKKIEFEKYYFNAPGNTSSFLKSAFGDNYMTLPDENNRSDKHIESLNYFK